MDLLALGGFVLLTASGILVRYRLPPGSGGLESAGVGPGALERPVALLFGLTRHEWGDIHFYLAVLLFAALTLHVYLHWNWFKCLFRKRAAEGDYLRPMLGATGLVTLVALAAAPFFAAREIVPRSELMDVETSVERVAVAIRGSTTLGEAATYAGTTPEVLAQALGIPEGTSPDETLGRLARTYGFAIPDVRRIVEALP